MKTIFFLLFILISIQTFSQIGFNVEDRNPTLMGAQGLGMAGACTANESDIYAIYWNPAFLQEMTKTKFALTLKENFIYVQSIPSDSYFSKNTANVFRIPGTHNIENFSFAMPFNINHVNFAVGLAYNNQYRWDERMDYTNVYEYSTTAVAIQQRIRNIGHANNYSFAFAMAVSNNMAMGFTINKYNAKYFTYNEILVNNNYTQFDYDSDSANYTSIDLQTSEFKETGKNIIWGFKYKLGYDFTLAYKITSPYKITHYYGNDLESEFIIKVPSFSTVAFNYLSFYFDYRFQNWKNTKIVYNEMPPFNYYNTNLSSFSLAFKSKEAAIGYQYNKYLTINELTDKNLASHLITLGFFSQVYSLSFGLEYMNRWLFSYDKDTEYTEYLNIYKAFISMDIIINAGKKINFTE